jgi:hypothetical protein
MTQIELAVDGFGGVGRRCKHGRLKSVGHPSPPFVRLIGVLFLKQLSRVNSPRIDAATVTCHKRKSSTVPLPSVRLSYLKAGSLQDDSQYLKLSYQASSTLLHPSPSRASLCETAGQAILVQRGEGSTACLWIHRCRRSPFRLVSPIRPLQPKPWDADFHSPSVRGGQSLLPKRYTCDSTSSSHSKTSTVSCVSP